jgi:hypothetical protein
MKLFLLLSVIFFTASCSFHRGSLTVSTCEFAVVHTDIAIGVSSTSKFLGIGGVSMDALIFEARKNMVKNHPLVADEQFNSVSVDIKNTYYLIGQKTKVTVVADVIVPKDSLSQSSYSEFYLKKSFDTNYNSDDLFSIGDSIVYNHTKSAELIGFTGRENPRAIVKYYSKKGNTRTKRLRLTKIFTVIPGYNGFKLGDRLGEGSIIAFGKEGAIVKLENSNVYFPYSE